MGFLTKHKALKGLFYFLGAILVLLLAVFAPIDRTPLGEQEFYQQEIRSLDTLTLAASHQSELQSGWAKINLTPTHQMPMAGYQKRDHFDSVHDSLYARILVLKNAQQTTALINVDLLIFPPALKKILLQRIEKINPNIFLYLSATHTHNGIGAWDDSMGGQFALGEFDYRWINETADRITAAIQNIKTIPSTVAYWERDANELVRNRLVPTSKKDGMLRGLILERSDSTRACFFTFSAHATTFLRTTLTLSADYPGAVINTLEKEYNFAMFMAGMVGSHSFKYLPEKEHALLEKEAQLLTNKFDSIKSERSTDSVELIGKHVPIQFGSSQLRVSENLKLRNWLFKTALSDLEGELTYLKVGNTLLIGTPCDFSGEIFVNESLAQYAKAKGLNLIITSFNGNYIGYITHDGHYDSVSRAEVREMNWVGPYYGQYFSEMIKKLIDKSQSIN